MIFSKISVFGTGAQNHAGVQKRRALVSTSALAILVSALPGLNAAHAQSAGAQAAQEPASIDEIVVTGSRVIRDGYEAPTPLTVVGVDAIEKAGVPNIAQLMNQMPTFAGSQSPSGNVGTNTGTAGINSLSLRGMGPTRTLVLLDGHRTVGGSLAGSVDINTLPQQLVTRVDTVTGGASAAYGSDALAGVVNFVLDREFVGIKGEVSGSITDYGDNETWKIVLTGGTAFANGRGHFIMSGEVGAIAGVQDPSNRDWNQTNIGVIRNPAYTATNGQPEQLVRDPVNNMRSAPGGLITTGPLKGIAFGQGGAPYQFDYGVFNDGTNMFGSSMASALSIHNTPDLGTKSNNQNIFLRASYDLSDDINVYFQSSWAHAFSYNVALSPLFSGNLTLRADNAFLPAEVAARAAALGVTSFGFGTTNADLDYRVPELWNHRVTNRNLLGLTGRWDAFGTTWTWEAILGTGITRQSSRNERNIHLPNYQLALDAVRAPNGAIVCRSSLTDPNLTDPWGKKCSPYNPFGVGVNSQAGIDYILGLTQRNEHYIQNVGSAEMSGEPFSNWAGPVSLALGVEHRSEKVDGSATTPIGGFLNGNYVEARGSYNVTEGFVETVVPLAKDMEWAKALDLNAGARATSYSTSGYVTTWKVGLTWSPIDDIRFRATRSRDIRAPNMQELFAGVNSSFQTSRVDPFNNNATVTVNVQSTGNLNLEPEKADTTGVGIVLQPTFLAGFSASVDYWNINTKSLIATISGPLNLCFLGYTQFCNSFQRVVQNGVALIIEQTQPVNIASQVTRGIDFEATYTMDLDTVVSDWAGSLRFNVVATNYIKQEEDPVLTPVFDRVGWNQGSGSGDSGLPHWRWNGSITYTTEALTLGLTGRGFSSGVIDPRFIECTSSCPRSTINNQTIDNNYVKGQYYFDTSIQYQVAEGITTFLNIQNVLNTDPVTMARTSINAIHYTQTNVNLYDALGRTFRAGVRFRM
jgi:iron complex outermembrane receptor protein